MIPIGFRQTRRSAEQQPRRPQEGEMDQEDKNTREKIILATIECIEKDGLHALTIRNIAKAAGVNIAAVNYYFGSKEKLTEITLEYALQNFQVDIEDILSHDDERLAPVFEALLVHFLEGGIRYPEITKAHLYQPLVQNKYENRFLKLFNTLVGDLYERCRKAKPNETEESVKLSLIQALAAMILPMLLPSLFHKSLGVDFHDERTGRQYIRSIIRNSGFLSTGRNN